MTNRVTTLGQPISEIREVSTLDNPIHTHNAQKKWWKEQIDKRKNLIQL